MGIGREKRACAEGAVVRPLTGSIKDRCDLRKALFSFLALVLCTLGAPQLASAQANYEGVQLGGRTAMMGGAAVASGEDQATAFINPAGITRIPGQSFSFSTFAASFTSRNIHSALDPSGTLGTDGTNVNQLQLRILPNTFCLFLNGPQKDTYSGRSRHKYAMCAAATEREQLDFTRTSENSTFGGGSVAGVGHSTSLLFVRSTMALSWGFQLDPANSIGVTARVDTTGLEDHTQTTTYKSENGVGDLHTLSIARDAYSWDSSLVIGITSNISRVVTLGASLTTPSQHLLGSYVGTTAIAISGNNSDLVIHDKGDFRYNHPGAVRMGLAFNWPRLILEVDGSFYGPQRQLARANFDRTESVGSADGQFDSFHARSTITERGRPVTNLSFGMEYFLQKDFSLIWGAQTDFSGVQKRPDRAADEVLFRHQKDAAHLSLGVSTYRKQGRLLLGLRGHYASGKILIGDSAPTAPSYVALSQNEWGLQLIVSGRISFRAVRDTAARAAEPFRNLSEDDSEEADGEDRGAGK